LNINIGNDEFNVNQANFGFLKARATGRVNFWGTGSAAELFGNNVDNARRCSLAARILAVERSNNIGHGRLTGRGIAVSFANDGRQVDSLPFECSNGVFQAEFWCLRVGIKVCARRGGEVGNKIHNGAPGNTAQNLGEIGDIIGKGSIIEDMKMGRNLTKANTTVVADFVEDSRHLGFERREKGRIKREAVEQISDFVHSVDAQFSVVAFFFGGWRTRAKGSEETGFACQGRDIVGECVSRGNSFSEVEKTFVVAKGLELGGVDGTGLLSQSCEGVEGGGDIAEVAEARSVLAWVLWIGIKVESKSETKLFGVQKLVEVEVADAAVEKFCTACGSNASEIDVTDAITQVSACCCTGTGGGVRDQCHTVLGLDCAESKKGENGECLQHLVRTREDKKKKVF
jgi:hypothetical protein